MNRSVAVFYGKQACEEDVQGEIKGGGWKQEDGDVPLFGQEIAGMKFKRRRLEIREAQEGNPGGVGKNLCLRHLLFLKGTD